MMMLCSTLCVSACFCLACFCQFLYGIDSHGIKRLLRRGRYVAIDSPLSASTVGSMHSGNATWLVRERLAVGEAGFRQLQFSTSRGGR